jgi:hypothetical protein
MYSLDKDLDVSVGVFLIAPPQRSAVDAIMHLRNEVYLIFMLM